MNKIFSTTDMLRRFTTIRDEALGIQSIGQQSPENNSPQRWQHAIDVVSKHAAQDFPLPADIGSDMAGGMPYGIAVHVTHCCERHGCKYSHDQSCAVVRGEFRQESPCERCEEPEEKLTKALEDLAKDYEGRTMESTDASMSSEAANAEVNAYWTVAEKIRALLSEYETNA